MLNQLWVNHLLGSLEPSCQLMPWLSVLARAGVDTYSGNRSVYSYFLIGAAGITSNVGSLTEEVI